MKTPDSNKILLTGASGFIGGHLIEELNDFELHAISTKSKHIQGVKTVYSWSKIDKIDGPFYAVIHLAGLAHDTRNKTKEQVYFDVNEGLTKKLLVKCSTWGVRSFVYLSSVKAVVDSCSSNKLNENKVSTSKNVYGRSKLAAEKAITNYNLACTKVILRPVMVYGKGQKGNLNTLEKLIAKGIPFPFKHWKNKRSILYVKNLTYCIHHILQKPIQSGVYFIADDKALSTIDILKNIANGIEKKARFISIPNKLIKLGLKIAPKSIKVLMDKLLGSLEVENLKLKIALKIDNMPIASKDGFRRTFLKN